MQKIYLERRLFFCLMKILRSQHNYRNLYLLNFSHICRIISRSSLLMTFRLTSCFLYKILMSVFILASVLLGSKNKFCSQITYTLFLNKKNIHALKLAKTSIDQVMLQQHWSVNCSENIFYLSVLFSSLCESMIVDAHAWTLAVV